MDGFVPVDVAQSVFREVRSTGALACMGTLGVTGVSFALVISAACMCLRLGLEEHFP